MALTTPDRVELCKKLRHDATLIADTATDKYGRSLRRGSLAHTAAYTAAVEALVTKPEYQPIRKTR
jgi:hypothetical protein